MNMGRLLFYMVLFIPSRTSPTPLLILKTPRCGSTWFTSLLNKLEQVYIQPEIISWRKRRAERVVEERNGSITSYIVESLRHPMLQWPEGEDLSRRDKSTVIIVGSTMYPRATAIDLGRIARSVPNLQVVALLRSNVVKHAISYIRAVELKRKCDNNQQHIGDCRLEKKTTINIETFQGYLRHVIADDRKIVKWAQELSENLGHSFLDIWYENLQENGFDIGNLIQWLGFDMKNLEVTKNYDGPCYINCTKITSDDLSLVIANYEELESYIKSTYPCLSAQVSEHNPGKVQLSRSILCGDHYINDTLDIIDRRTDNTDFFEPY